MPRKGCVWAKALTPARKAEITAACERPIAEMKARHLPVAGRPAPFGVPIDIRGRWRTAEHAAFLADLRTRFARRRTFIKLLDQPTTPAKSSRGRPTGREA